MERLINDWRVIITKLYSKMMCDGFTLEISWIVINAQGLFTWIMGIFEGLHSCFP